MSNQTWSSGASRRDILKGLAAAGIGAVASTTGLIAQNNGANPRRIDMHHHYQLPGTGRGEGAGWTPEKALEVMDQHGVETTILSRPGGEAYDGTEKGSTFARRINEYGAKMASDPDIAASVRNRLAR